MENQVTTRTLTELTATAESHLLDRGYSKHYTLAVFRIWRELKAFCAKNGERNYSAELGQRFLAERLAAKILSEDRRSVINRSIQLLTDFHQFGTVIIRRSDKRAFLPQFADCFNSYLNELRRCNRSENTIRSQTHSLNNLTEFLDGIGVRSIGELTLAHMNEYIKLSLCNYCQSSAATRLRDARNLLAFLYKSGQIADDIAAKLIRIKSSSAPVHLPSAFTAADIGRLLATVDRVSPPGKRDYAVLLLAAKTGLRLGDIQNLKFENLDWSNNAIRLTQVKTKEPLTLPLLPDVGWALIDYIKSGRPVSDSPHVFLRERAPYEPLMNFDNILVKHLRQAGISTAYVRHHGLHALRHGLATTLLEQDTPINTIQSILGHVNMETTQKYTAVNVRELRECALEVPSV